MYKLIGKIRLLPNYPLNCKEIVDANTRENKRQVLKHTYRYHYMQSN